MDSEKTGTTAKNLRRMEEAAFDTPDLPENVSPSSAVESVDSEHSEGEISRQRQKATKKVKRFDNAAKMWKTGAI